ncbi:MAG: threonine--tRNA ligase [bacterium]|nr:threonine--tRNA ligase [bacterium]
MVTIDFSRQQDRDTFRHSASHIMAHAVKSLFPEAKLAIGPSIDEGFYYDFDLPQTLTPDILAKIEERMQEIVAADRPFVREEMSRTGAIEYFKHLDEPYKVELLHELEDDIVSLYREGDFVDLCRGPHLEQTGQVKAFKLLSVAGAYWRGSEKNKMLQRIYGTAFPDKKTLGDHLRKLESAKERDHRKLGKELDLYSTHDQAGSGLIYWHPKGALIREIIEDFWRKEHRARGYQLVYTPHLFREDLLRTSGHLEFYKENMYPPMDVDGINYYVKPMNCPGHILIYANKVRSYRELPIRLAELGTVYRYERGGTLHGMLRVRGFTQDDSHIFCTPEQLKDEILGVLHFADYMMRTFHYEYKLYLSTRPEKYVGSDEVWEMAQGGLREALEAFGTEYDVDEGGGVFYGPKIDVKVFDALGREWQGPTIQVDLNFPERFDLTYVGPDGEHHRPIAIHRVVLGAMERFIGGLIEHYEGYFPLWLSPVQVRILTVTDDHLERAKKLKDEMEAKGLRVELDDRNESMNLKIRDSQLQKIPYTLVVGDREIADNTVSVRKFRKGPQGSMPVGDFIQRALEEVASRARE